MLWMGEEWAASTRWPFFTSHPEPELGAATAAGRVEEFAAHGWDAAQVADPQDPQTYRQAVLDWAELDGDAHAGMLAWYRRLIALRAGEPELRDDDLRKVDVEFDEDARWLVLHRGGLHVAVNVGDEEREVPLAGRELVLATGPAELTATGLRLGAQSGAVVRA
jgi:maltooligosyltrehalose trehalohydrolase